jgi:hypothetical protein
MWLRSLVRNKHPVKHTTSTQWHGRSHCLPKYRWPERRAPAGPASPELMWCAAGASRRDHKRKASSKARSSSALANLGRAERILALFSLLHQGTHPISHPFPSHALLCSVVRRLHARYLALTWIWGDCTCLCVARARRNIRNAPEMKTWGAISRPNLYNVLVKLNFWTQGSSLTRYATFHSTVLSS